LCNRDYHPLTQVLLDACEKRGWPLSAEYGDKVLRRHNGKLVAALNATEEELYARRYTHLFLRMSLTENR
jgi:hypothetical protein